MISGNVLLEIQSFIDASQITTNIVSQLKEKWPMLHFTYCFDDDICEDVKAAFESDKYNLYFVDASEHCLKLTNDSKAATGLVIAEHVF